MNCKFTGRGRAVALAGLLAGVGALAASGCMFNRATSEKSASKTQRIREEPMSVVQENRTIQHANQANFDQQVLQSDVPVLVDFYADWCGPCQRLAPVLEELAAETPNAKIVKINVEHSPDLAAKYGVESIPSLMVFKNGMTTNRLVGLASKQQLRTLLTR
jgi:thioredoxin 1